MVKNKPIALKSKRLVGTRDTKSTYLIVTEGQETEPNYFNGLKQYYLSTTVSIQVMPASGTDPLSVVDYAEKLIRNGYTNQNGKGFGPKSFENVFVVFDQDCNVEGRKRAQAKIKELDGKYKTSTKEAIRFHCIDSVPNFELWLLLHFERLHPQKMEIDEPLKRLKRYWPNYQKKSKDVFDKTRPNLNIAIHRAESLNKDPLREVGDVRTNVHLIVKELIPKTV